ncbi:MAG: hypothetical protein K9L78_02725, partial [Victivallales bacterium]|nr:hypothetical protein [Victivallales bacterium]
IVGRVKTQYIKLVPKAVKTAKSLVGLPYNDTFNIKDNKAFYCSQLVYYCFKKANMGKMLFKLHPMTFRKPGTKQIFKIWKEYFKKLKTSVPEGAPGLNPGGMSKSKVLNIVYIYGNITGMKNEK